MLSSPLQTLNTSRRTIIGRILMYEFLWVSSMSKITSVLDQPYACRSCRTRPDHPTFIRAVFHQSDKGVDGLSKCNCSTFRKFRKISQVIKHFSQYYLMALCRVQIHIDAQVSLLVKNLYRRTLRFHLDFIGLSPLRCLAAWSLYFSIQSSSPPIAFSSQFNRRATRSISRPL